MGSILLNILGFAFIHWPWKHKVAAPSTDLWPRGKGEGRGSQERMKVRPHLFILEGQLPLGVPHLIGHNYGTQPRLDARQAELGSI